MQLVLLAAGIGSLYPLKQLGTGLLLILLTLFNVVMGLQQEGKAAAAVAALQKMVIIKAKVSSIRCQPGRPRTFRPLGRPPGSSAWPQRGRRGDRSVRLPAAGDQACRGGVASSSRLDGH
jgi:hypothetical protein